MGILKKIVKSIFKGWVRDQKGCYGEQKVALNIWLSLDDQIYKRFHDIIIPSTNGTTQIDHILVSTYGVFIIETKNKTGWVFGSEDQASWTQIVFKEKYTFQNPLRQTYRQRRILAEFIKLDESYIYPVVFFAGDCVFKTPMPSNVISSDLGGYIRNFQEWDLSQEKVKDIVKILEKHLLESDLSNSDHVRSLRERHNSKTICPKCGNNLLQKTVRKGPNEGSTFLGCSKYPQCRFTRNT